MGSPMMDEFDNPADIWEKLVNAVSLIGLTTETAEYLLEHDPYALEQIDEALNSIGTPVSTLRARSIDGYIEMGYTPSLGNTFLPITEHGVDHQSVEEYIDTHLDDPNGSWELVFFPDDEPEPTGENEDYTDKIRWDTDMDDDDALWALTSPSTEFDTEEASLAETGSLESPIWSRARRLYNRRHPHRDDERVNGNGELE